MEYLKTSDTNGIYGVREGGFEFHINLEDALSVKAVQEVFYSKEGYLKFCQENKGFQEARAICQDSRQTFIVESMDKQQYHIPQGILDALSRRHRAKEFYKLRENEKLKLNHYSLGGVMVKGTFITLLSWEQIDHLIAYNKTLNS